MSHEEFMKTLCKIVSDYAIKEHDDAGIPCFCGNNEISKIEIGRGTFKGNKAILHSLVNKLEVETEIPE